MIAAPIDAEIEKPMEISPADDRRKPDILLEVGTAYATQGCSAESLYLSTWVWLICLGEAGVGHQVPLIRFFYSCRIAFPQLRI